jgi:hypothetical protein
MLQILGEDIPAERLPDTALRCWNEVGQVTDNSSLRETLAEFVRQTHPLPPPSRWLYPTYWSVVAAHGLIILGDFAAAVCLVFWVCGLPTDFRWCFALPVVHWVVWIASSRIADCPATRCENYLRVRLGLPRIRGYIGHYVVDPVRRRFGTPS